MGGLLNGNPLTVSDIAEIVLGFLAAEGGTTPGLLRAQLATAGAELPVDSILIAEVLTKVEDTCAVRLPVSADTARSTRSVMTFAQTVYEALGGSDGIA